MSDSTNGGHNILSGGNNNTVIGLPFYGNVYNYLYGDAFQMSGSAHGGNDTLISGTGNDDMYGDAQVMLDHAHGGSDTFVFNFNSGHDTIEDFGQGVHGVAGSNEGTDHIDVSALGIESFSEINISAFDPVTHVSTITFSPGNDVVVHSQVALTQQDFLFTAHTA